MILQLLFRIILLSWPMISRTQAQELAKSHCPSKCGNVTIPFPFGIGKGCYIDDWFAIDCDSSNKPFINRLHLEVLEISLKGTMRVNHRVLSSCSDSYDSSTLPYGNLLAESPFVFSQESNRFTALGCNNLAYMSTSEYLVLGGCISMCDDKIKTGENGCYGIKCCQTRISSSLKVFNISIESTELNRDRSENGCKYAFLVDQNWFETSLKKPEDVKQMSHVPVVLDWRTFNSSFNQFATNKQKRYKSTYSCEVDANFASSTTANSSAIQLPVVHCKCHSGFEGNPYLLQGCQDINECDSSKRCGNLFCENIIGGYRCFSSPTKKSKNTVIIGIGTSLGSIFLLIGAWWLCIIIKKTKEKKLKEKYFKQNGGLLLEKQLTSLDGSVDRSKLFISKDLDKATDHFNVDRKIGEGGQGTVYKGMLTNGRIVAVKKSKVVDDDGKLQEFINEVVILSKIKHRNIVELLGYCLETKVPLLVYEFIPNGTLFEYLHDPKEDFLPLTWDMRLRIATEVVDALSYLHSAASMAIYHRDIKSANILLDNKYRAKVADFGISKSIEVDQTHATTKVVKGTIGYIDPEYFQSRQFTNKSDVYSFGVVLIELLTEQKPISSKGGSLVQKFIETMKENHLFDILGAQLKDQGKGEEIMAVANIAYRCVNRKGSKRPTMKEVSMELQRIQTWENNNLHQNYEETENMRSEVLLPWDGPSTSTGSTFDSRVQLTNFQPLLHSI